MTVFARFSDIFDLWRSRAEAGRALGLKEDTARKYATGERSFPLELVDSLVVAAQSRPGGDAVTHEMVVRLAADASAAAGRRAA